MPRTTPEAIPAVEWRDGVLRLIDQALLPHEVRYINARDAETVAAAIRRLSVRGAPLIGIAAAYALALAARAGGDLRAAADTLVATRPTAVNLRWAVDRVLAAASGAADPAAAAEAEAVRIHAEQVDADARMGEAGAALISDDATVLTHCNTGSLATGGIGTALGVVKTAHGQGKRPRVLVGETRPLLQGARLTAWELEHAGIPHDVIADGAAAGLIARGGVQAVLVGADRIAANGDTANKVGTYPLALAARAHDVPFYVVAPASTVDLATRLGRDITIEQRDPDEVLGFAGGRVAPAASTALNPAFDVTPADLVTAIVTERGVVRVPYARSLPSVVAPQQAVAS